MARVRYWALFLVVVLWSTAIALAQETTGSITGKVVDRQGFAVPGAAVTATGSQGASAVTTDSDGRFEIPFLTPALYSVRVQLPGFKTFEQGDLIVSLGQTVDLRIRIEVGDITETLDVTTSLPLVDTSSTTTGGIIDSDLLAHMPLSRRMSDTPFMAPGVSPSGTSGAANPSISGGSGLDNRYLIDGDDVTNVGFGGFATYSRSHGSLGATTPFDFVKEVQVKTGGYEAEFGRSMGGIVNVVTKSGTNALHASIFGYGRPSSTEGVWTQFQTINGSVQTLSTDGVDAGVEGGGPVIKNRTFFFGAVDPQWERRVLQAPVGFPLVQPAGYERIRRYIPYAAKGTFQLNRHRIDASFFGDPSTGEMGSQRLAALLGTDTSSFTGLDFGSHSQTVRYSGVVGRWVIEMSFGRALSTISETPLVNQWRTADVTVTPTRITGGIGSYEQGDRSLDEQYSIKAANTIAGHEIKYGFGYDVASYDWINNLTGPTFVDPTGRRTATGAFVVILPDPVFGRIYRVTHANYNVSRPTTQLYRDVFVQDSWKAGNRLTVNAGIRYEQETVSGVVVKDWTLQNNWSPRIGVSYDVLGDAKSKIFAHYGIYHARLPNDSAATALSADTSIRRADYFDPDLTRPIPDGVQVAGTALHFQTAGGSALDIVDSAATLPYLTELVFGVERALAINTTIGASYIYRDIGRVLEDVETPGYPMVAYNLGLAAPQIQYIITNPTNKSPVPTLNPLLAATFDNPVHTYHAFAITFNRRLANNWSLLTSYQWSRLRGNFEGFYRSDNGQTDPATSSLFDFPSHDPSYTAIGVSQFHYRGDIRYLGQNGILPLDRPHQAKVFGSYVLPGGLNLGLAWTVSSGAPLTPFAANPIYTNGGEIPEAPRGSGILTVDGFKMRTPVQSQTDVQVVQSLRLAGRTRLALIVDVFNLFNQQTVLDYDTWTELAFGVPNPDFGKPVSQVISGTPPRFQSPRQIRLGARVSF